MAKPILVIRINFCAIDGAPEAKESLEKQTNNEYHILFVGQETNDPIFEVYNVDKEPEIDYEQLKKLLEL